MQTERDKTRGLTFTPNTTNKLTCKKQKQNKTKNKTNKKAKVKLVNIQL